MRFLLQKGAPMKRFLCPILSLILLFCAISPLNAYAETGGSGNLDGGGGGMGSGTSTNVWNTGNEGVRVTVVRASDHAQVTTPIDFTNKTPSANIYHFGKVSKMQYSTAVCPRILKNSSPVSTHRKATTPI